MPLLLLILAVIGAAEQDELSACRAVRNVRSRWMLFVALMQQDNWLHGALLRSPAIVRWQVILLILFKNRTSIQPSRTSCCKQTQNAD